MISHNPCWQKLSEVQTAVLLHKVLATRYKQLIHTSFLCEDLLLAGMLDTPMFQQISKITHNHQQNVPLLDHLLSSCLESMHVTQVSVGGYNPAKTNQQ